MMGVVRAGDRYEAAASSGTVSHWYEYQINLATTSLGNIASSRSLGTVYQNTSAKDILVIASWPTSNTETNNFYEGDNSSVTNTIDSESTQGNNATMIGVIHPGQYYKLNRGSGAGAIEFWYELTLN
jgi:hypothetical protein